MLRSATGAGCRYIRSRETRFDGMRQFAFAKIGSYTSGPAYAAADFGVSMGVSAGWDVAREFLPDLLHRKHGSRPS
jgi:hypothetical protein